MPAENTVLRASEQLQGFYEDNKIVAEYGLDDYWYTAILIWWTCGCL